MKQEILAAEITRLSQDQNRNESGVARTEKPSEDTGSESPSWGISKEEISAVSWRLKGEPEVPASAGPKWAKHTSVYSFTNRGWRNSPGVQ